MRFRVVDMDGNDMAEMGREFILFADGTVWVADLVDGDLTPLDTPHAVEFAFHKDTDGNWLYEDTVFGVIPMNGFDENSD